jgi:UDPglucose 6-dehydrogenase
MRVGVIGSGYVGLVTAACLAETGNEVVCADIDEGKIARLRRNEMPIFEPGLEELVRHNQAQGRLRFTTGVPEAIRHGRVVFIAVGTPPREDGSADLQQVLDVATLVGQHLNEPKVIATKSTVPVGTAAKVRAVIQSLTDKPFHVCSNPEFLKQGAAVEDFMKPDRVVVGVEDPEAHALMEELYAPYMRTGNRLLFMDIASAEVTKYAANAMLAARISFMNQVAELCERVGADVTNVRLGIAADRRIGPAFLFPGPGYGGSCFPKDVKALVRTALDTGMTPDLFMAVEAVNERQKQVLFRKVAAHLGPDLTGQTVGLWGLAFKAGTDDMRESPAIPLVEALLEAGATVRAHDPQAGEAARRIFGSRIGYCDDPYECVRGASALVVVTEWLMYRTPDFERIRALMHRALLVDGRNLYSPERVRRYGFDYDSIGRGTQ